MTRRSWIGSAILFLTIIGVAAAISMWKYSSMQEANAQAANQPEPMESVTVAIAKERSHRPTITSIGTVTALRSITLLNEVAGTVDRVMLTSGQVVEAGTVLVKLDVSVEEAEWHQQEAQASLAEASLARMKSVSGTKAVSEIEVDRAEAELEIARAQVARTKAIIARKIIRAPFRARVGISDVHPGQYLNEGTQLTTLQGVDDGVYVDFAVAQQVAAGLRKGNTVEVLTTTRSTPIRADVIAVDARVDPNTRNATVRAKIQGAENSPSPGASVRVQVPAGEQVSAISIPVSALRKGPAGDHVFIISPDKAGKTRAHMRQVESGIMLGDEVLILKGLNAGEQVAASGSFKLREDALVVISNQADKSANSR